MLHPPILAWSAKMDDELAVMLEGKELKKLQLFETTGDETSFNGIVTALYIAPTAPNAYDNVVADTPPPPPEIKTYFWNL